MLARSFALLAVLGLAGCDIIEEIQPEPTVPFTVDSIVVEGLREMRTSSAEWDDDGTAPDVFVEIQNSAGATISRSGVVDNADVTQPLSIDFPSPVEAPTETATMFVVAFDSDGSALDSEKMGTSEGFTIADIRAASGALVLEDIRAENGREAVYTIVQ